MKKLCLLALPLALTIGAVSGLAQSADELVNAGRNADNVTTHSMGYDRKSYSPLRQITRANVKRLVPVWSTSVWNETGELAAPAVYNGMMYVINGRWTFALVTRSGPAIYNGKLYRVTYDNHLLALDMKTGKEVWNQKFAEAKEGYYSTGAPIVANGVVISGMAGGERTTRGFLDGWDPETGAKLWRRYTI